MPARILIIEDYPATAQFISELLGMEGFMSAYVRAGRAGIEKARNEKPDIILLDVMLPEVSGLEVCRELKADPITARIPVILISVRGSAEDKRKGFESGCDGYIVKPFEVKDLIDLIKVYLK